MLTLAPVVLFVYNRINHTKETINFLKRNIYANESELFIFSDGPKNNDEDSDKIREVRNYLSSIDGFKNITIIEQSQNIGLADSIISGVTDIINKFGKVIVLEDDIVTSIYFLKHMNFALDNFKNNSKIMHVSGYTPPISTFNLKDTFFTRLMFCWGWATWKESWDFFKKDINLIFNTFSEKDIKRFDLDGTANIWSQVKGNKEGRLNTWAVFWYSSIFINNGLSLCFKKSLTNNIGLDGSGINCGINRKFNIQLENIQSVTLPDKIIEDRRALKELKKFYSSHNKLIPKIKKKIYLLIRKYK